MKAAKPSGKRQSRADLGVLGKLYPAVNGRWDTNADNLSLTDMKPKVNYKAGDDILASRWFFQSLRFVKAAKPSGKRQSRADLGVLGKLYPAVKSWINVRGLVLLAGWLGRFRT